MIQYAQLKKKYKIMLRIIDQTDAEKQEMYMKLTKNQLVDMLIECNKQLDMLIGVKYANNKNNKN
jgi:hypothetical protein